MTTTHKKIAMLPQFSEPGSTIVLADGDAYYVVRAKKEMFGYMCEDFYVLPVYEVECESIPGVFDIFVNKEEIGRKPAIDTGRKKELITCYVTEPIYVDVQSYFMTHGSYAANYAIDLSKKCVVASVRPEMQRYRSERFPATVLFRLKDEALFDYASDSEYLHNEYGGKQYYVSRSGATSAGYLERKYAESELVELGWYYSDTRDRLELNGACKHTIWDKEGKSHTCDIYVPVSKTGIRYSAPVIVYYGDSILLLLDSSLGRLMSEGPGVFSYSSFEAEAYDNVGRKCIRSAFVCDEFDSAYSKRLLNALIMHNANWYTRPDYTDNGGMLVKRLGCYKMVIKGECGEPDRVIWGHKGLCGICDYIYDQDPLTIKGRIPFTRFEGDGEGMCWTPRSGENDYFVFIEVPMTRVLPKKLCRLSGSEGMVEYEEHIPAIEWIKQGKDGIRKRMLAACETKAVNTIMYYSADSEKIMEMAISGYGEVTVSMADAVEMGNCKIGTKEFVRKHDLPLKEESDTIMLKDLVEHKNFKSMLNSNAFIRTLWRNLIRAMH